MWKPPSISAEISVVSKSIFMRAGAIVQDRLRRGVHVDALSTKYFPSSAIATACDALPGIQQLHPVPSSLTL